MSNSPSAKARSSTRTWITRGVVGIVLATFFSDVAHEMATAVLPMYLASIGLGAATLGAIEGFADLVLSLAKLGGGVLGHRVHKKRPLVALGYLATMLGTGAMSLVQSTIGLVLLRGAAWIGRGFRSPLRDFLLADEVEPSHYGRAYGFERSADMLGALAGPLIAVLLVSLKVELGTIILWTILPAAIPVIAILLLTRDRSAPSAGREHGEKTSSAAREQSEKTSSAVRSGATSASSPLPDRFKRFLPGVLLFGLGDFSRTFLILLASRALGEDGKSSTGTISIAVLLYVMHNGISALAAYPIGRLADRMSKLDLLIGGYALGVATNLLLAFTSSSVAWLVIAIVLSGIYIAVEETVEKAAAAEMLPREQKSLGFGVLAAANAVGDMLSSVGVGLLLDAGRTLFAFGLPAAAGAFGTAWMILAVRRAAANRGRGNRGRG
jgi:MFS family permease